MIGDIYYWGKGVAVDYERALAAYKIGAEGGHAVCQHQLGVMLSKGYGCDVDYEQALVWLEKSAAQGLASAVCSLADMAVGGRAQQPSWRRARELYQRAIALGQQQALELMHQLNGYIRQVARSQATTPVVAAPTPPHPTPSSPPSWTSGSWSTAPPATT